MEALWEALPHISGVMPPEDLPRPKLASLSAYFLSIRFLVGLADKTPPARSVRKDNRCWRCGLVEFVRSF
jgi:hypothetical protein